MKLSSDLWDEWLSSPVTDPVSAASELAGIVSTLDLTLEDRHARLTADRFWVFRRVRRLWPRTRWSGLHAVSALFKVGRNKVALSLPAGLYNELVALPDSPAFIAFAWARGVWGVCGSLYMPKAGYYCLLRIRQPLVASRMGALFSGLYISFATRQKAGASELILRDLNDIQRLCGYLKLPGAEAELQARGLARSMRDLANRQANCDDANIRRAVRAAGLQAHLSRFAQAHMKLPPHLAELVSLRLAHPGATLGELGDLMNPQMSKSTVKYRWERLLKLAEAQGYERPEDGAEE